MTAIKVMSENKDLGSSDAEKHLFSDKTTFGTIAKFKPIESERTLDTQRFLQACTDLTTVLDRLGSQFSIAKRDMIGNIKRIDDRFKTNTARYVTLNAILEDHANQKPLESAVIGLIWLKRSLEFLRVFILNLSSDYQKNVEDVTLRQTVLKAYETTLKQYHGKLSRFMFTKLTHLVPYRKDFLKALLLNEEATLEMLFSDIDLYLPNLSDNIDLIESLLNQYGLNTGEAS
ncbi:unnamed protein product [Lymnaea stagnalis]|uniref:Glycolipid transfer protein domain-containing protein n=1 Tax=Lymnaea stagnalis TaxID=6523 RepID=A0AAV2H4D2_LYMST